MSAAGRFSCFFVLSETRPSRRSCIPSQIRHLTFDPWRGSASGQCKAAPVAQIGKEQLSKWSRAVHECVCVVAEDVGEGCGVIKENKRQRGENDKGWEERWRA